MTVLHQIVEWSDSRPAWQRDALRRLVLHGELSKTDIDALVEICKATHGLSDPQEITPLTQAHVPDRSDAGAPISLVSILHHKGVNALAERQTLRFAPALTVVYGDNAAGKTGYIRILKGACRARGRETILGNVVSGRTPLRPEVAIKYKVGTDDETREWAGSGEDEFISRVSVFDAQSAAVYLTEKTDVAFRPFGLDLFDKLVKACKAVRIQLEREKRTLTSNELAKVQAKVPEGTGAARLLANITSLTKPETVQKFSDLSTNEEARSALLEKSIVDLRTNDPLKVKHRLQLRAERLKTLVKHVRNVEAALSEEAVAAVLDVRAKCRLKLEEAKRIRDASFSAGMLLGTGSKLWTALWESARRFSNELAYRDNVFPVVEVGAHCVLCQQDLDHAARHRLEQFESFVGSTVEQELRQIGEAFEDLCNRLNDLEILPAPILETLEEIRIEDEHVSDSVRRALVAGEERRRAIARVLSEDGGMPSDVAVMTSSTGEIEALVGQIQKRIETIQTKTTDEARMRIEADVREFRARKLLKQHAQIVFDEIERKRKIAAYGLCVDDTRTQAITRKSTAVTRATITQRLERSFQCELTSLDFRHVEVELKAIGGSEGVLYHKLLLSRAPGVELPKVVSEGEQRCLSIAAFFAELSTAENPSGIVFDDPVSSLDYKWRESVARRLVDEAKIRQVIVFTHDVVFLLLLKQFANENGVEDHDQHVRQLAQGAGVCADDLPWVALKVKKRIGHLKKLMQDAEQLHRDGHQHAYERDESFIYGYLREAWERGVEEILLGGIVERYRPGVQTQQVAVIADITDEDCRAVKIAMTKCSKWLPGHDQAAAATADLPEPMELRADIKALENWVDTIRKRR